MEKFIVLMCLFVVIFGVAQMSLKIVELKNELHDRDQRIKNLIGYIKLLTQ